MAVENIALDGLIPNVTGRPEVIKAISIGSDGTEQDGLPPGRAAAADSVPVALSTEDKTALDAASGVYTNAVAYAGPTTAGRGIAVRMSVAGSVTVTMSGGGTIVVDAPIGTSIFPLAATNVVVATGTMTTAYKLT